MKKAIRFVITAMGLYLLSAISFNTVWAAEMQVAAGNAHSVGLKTDGTVVATGSNSGGQCDVSAWSGIVQISAGGNHTAGVKSDNTVVIAGSSSNIDVSSWTDIVQVAVGDGNIVGLKSDGTVVATGDNSYGQCDVSSWGNIIAISAGGLFTMGLTGNGGVLTTQTPGSTLYCDVSDWDQVKMITAGEIHMAVVKINGLVDAMGRNISMVDPACEATCGYDQCDVTSWTGITQIAGGGGHTVGLKSDGTVVATGKGYQWQVGGASPIGGIGYWTDIKQVAAGGNHTVGVKHDGSVVAAGSNDAGQRDVSFWDLSSSQSGTTWYKDLDGDGFGDPNEPLTSMTGQPSNYVSDNTDCDDSDADIHPGAVLTPGAPVKNGVDYDCDGIPNNESSGSTPLYWYPDLDGDGYGDSNGGVIYNPGSPPDGYVANDNTDCDDTDPDINPGRKEIDGDGIDQNCDGSDGNAGTGTTWYQDADNDGWGDPDISVNTGSQPSGYVADNTDCDDSDPDIYPGAPETAGDGIDQDCTGYDLSNTIPFADTPSVSGSTVTQTFFAAGNDYYKTGDMYVLTTDYFWDGNTWMTTETPYASGVSLGKSIVTYDVSGFKKGTKIYVGYGVGVSDTVKTMNSTGTLVKGYEVTQDFAGTGPEEISILSPTHNSTVGFGGSGGKVTFSFSKVGKADKYTLHLNLTDMLAGATIEIPLELVPPGNTTGIWSVWAGATPGFSEEAIGMVYELSLDQATWDILALYDMAWGVEAYDKDGELVGSTFEGSSPEKYVNGLKFIAGSAIAMTSPSNKATLDKSDAAPAFQWDTHQGADTYLLVLAHVGSLGFDTVITRDNLTLNLFPMDGPTWQSMPQGTWYWTVLGYDALGNQTPAGFTLFDFEVQ